MRNKLLAAAFLFSASLTALAAPEINPPHAKQNPFFAFCMDTHDTKKRDLAQQAEMLKDLGYDGAGHLWLDKVSERLKTLDAAGLRLFQITLMVDIAPGKTPYDPRLKEVVPLLKGRSVQFALLVNGLKPSDPAGDARAVEVVREIASLSSEAGAQVVLYPHTAFWLERIEDALRVADKVDRTNVGVMFNLCHWLRVSKDRDYKQPLRKALPRLLAVSINGADDFDPQPGWSRYIQPLGQGSFDVLAFLKALGELGYSGPIGLQCYGIQADAYETLGRSIKAYRAFQRELAVRK